MPQPATPAADPAQAPGRRSSPLVGIAVLLLIATAMGSNHVASRVAFDHGASVPTAVLARAGLNALFAFLLSWGNFPLSLFTTGADTTVPEYLYAKMVAGYTPGVPVLGTVSTVGAAILLIGGYAAILAMRRAKPAE